VVAVDNGEVEAATVGKEAREHDLRLCGVELHEIRDPGLVEELKAAVGKSRSLVWVDDDMTSRVVSVRKQAFTHEQRRDPVSEADLDGASRVLALDPIP
jgi:hypothetical protein